ncbi:MAG: hypothetical protein K0S08_1443 [Gammaproteobacteria bacterium]|jgi:hypothetical protein|nr:hypothetical protein [Gammaproteobacteria bacterium]
MPKFSKEYALAALAKYLQERGQKLPVITQEAFTVLIDYDAIDSNSAISQDNVSASSISPSSFRANAHFPSSPLPWAQSPIEGIFSRIKHASRNVKWTKMKCEFAKIIYEKIALEPLNSSQHYQKLIVFLEANLQMLKAQATFLAGKGELELLVNTFIRELTHDRAEKLFVDLSVKAAVFLASLKQLKEVNFRALEVISDRLNILTRYLVVYALAVVGGKEADFTQEELTLIAEQCLLGLVNNEALNQFILREEYKPLLDTLIAIKPDVQIKIDRIKQQTLQVPDAEIVPNRRFHFGY